MTRRFVAVMAAMLFAAACTYSFTPKRELARTHRFAVSDGVISAYYDFLPSPEAPSTLRLTLYNADTHFMRSLVVGLSFKDAAGALVRLSKQVGNLRSGTSKTFDIPLDAPPATPLALSYRYEPVNELDLLRPDTTPGAAPSPSVEGSFLLPTAK